MKKMVRSLLSIVLLSVLLIGMNTGNFAQGAEGDTIKQHFPDPNMAQAVADKIASGDVNAVLTSSMINGTTSLDMADRGIDSIEGVQIFSNLARLYIAGNNITSLPDNIGDLTKLERMDAGRNKLTAVPDSLGSLSNLKTLNLKDSKLGVFPDTILNLSGLDSLYLEDTGLTEVPNDIERLISLEYLDLAGNELTELPNTVCNLANLFFLDLSGNKLTFIPEDIGTLNDLGYLALAGNNIRSLPDSLMDLDSLISFSFEYNNLTDLPSAQYNFITSIGSSELNNQKYVEEIDTIGYLNEPFSFDALPAQEQFLNYGLVFSYTLVTPDGQTISMTPSIIDGVIIVDSAYLGQEGQYTLISDGSGGPLSPVQYKQIFNVEAAPIPLPEVPDPNKPGVPDPDKTGKPTVTTDAGEVSKSVLSKTPKTGGEIHIITPILILFLSGGILFGARKKHL